MFVWEPDKNVIRRANREDLFEAIYILTMLIPLGKVTSYGEIARVLKISPRFVGLALKKNRKPIIIPCHRVVGSNGELKNYSLGGPSIKEKLLRIEGVIFRDKRVTRDSMYSLGKFLLDP